MKLSEVEIRRQIDRLLQSRSLQSSDVQRRLLHYLAEKSLAGDGGGLKEYTVAIDALGKPPTYDPRHDSGVRIQLGRLRNKLMEYYSSEGAADPVVVSIPKGSFKMNFEGASPAGDFRPGGSWSRREVTLALAAVAAMTWAAFATVAAARLRREAAPVVSAWTPELEELWAPLLSGGRPLVLCVGTPLLARFPDQGFLRVPGPSTWEELRKTKPFMILEKGTPGGEPMPWYAYTGVGEAGAAFVVGGLLGTRRRDVRFTRSNLLSWQEISDSDLVFLGPPKFNHQLQGLPIKQEITIEPGGVRILNPAPGEPAFLPDFFQPGPQFDGTTHALISHTPGLSGHGHLLTLAGNGSPDTLAAAQWLTEPVLAKELAGRLRLPSGKLPPYYQVVVKVDFKNGVPVENRYLFHHLLQAR